MDEILCLFDELYIENKGMVFDSVYVECFMMDWYEVYYCVYFEWCLIFDYVVFGDFILLYCILSVNELCVI